jgi:uncharacterized OsmC-like protein
MPPTWRLTEYLERKRRLVDAYRAQLRTGELAPAPLRASVRVAAGTGLRPVRIRDHAVVTDAGAALGGFGLGASAPELLLGALASCLAHSALVIAADRGIALDELEVDVSGQLDYRGTLSVDAEAPVPPTGLRYVVRVAGACDDADLAQLHTDLDRLCPVLLAITRPTSVAGRVERHVDA